VGAVVAVGVGVLQAASRIASREKTAITREIRAYISASSGGEWKELPYDDMHLTHAGVFLFSGASFPKAKDIIYGISRSGWSISDNVPVIVHICTILAIKARRVKRNNISLDSGG
jgi:hypothetical protein